MELNPFWTLYWRFRKLLAMTEAPFFWDEVQGNDLLCGAFLPRVANVSCGYDKWEVLDALEPSHRAAVIQLGFSWENLWRAEQIHGVEVAAVPAGGLPFYAEKDHARSQVVAGVDALVTNTPGVLLGIYVADCGAVYFHDRRTGAVGLAHSGKKGTEGNITRRVLETMHTHYGTRAEDVAVGLGPCIRPPHYEPDFALQIAQQARAYGVADFQDCGICTGAEVRDYYSYRLEKGKTGRMLALLGRRE